MTLTREWHALVIDGAAVLNKTANFIYQNNPTVNLSLYSQVTKEK